MSAKATAVQPLVDFAALCDINDVELPYDGGRVKIRLLIPDEVRRAQGLVQGDLVLYYDRDPAMRAFPSTRPEMEAKRYRVVVLPLEDAPPPAPASVAGGALPPLP
jgi:hypothetical protein